MRLLVYARRELVDRAAVAAPGVFAPTAAPDVTLLLEGSWPADASGGPCRSLDESIDGRFAWIDQRAAELAGLLDPSGADHQRSIQDISPAYLNALALRYYLVKLIRPLAYLGQVQPLAAGSRLELVAAAGRDEDYAEVLSQYCRAAGVHLRVRWIEGCAGPDVCFPPNGWWRRVMGRLSSMLGKPKGDSPIFAARKSGQSPACSPKGDSPILAARKSGQSPAHSPKGDSPIFALRKSEQSPACSSAAPDAADCGRRVVLCGDLRLLDPVCRELLARGCTLWWLGDRFAVRAWLRWRAAGVAQLLCDCSLGRENRLAVDMPARLECLGVNLAGPVRRWLLRRVATHGPRQTRMIEQLDAHMRRVRPDALVLDEDATSLARAAVAVGRHYGVRSLVVQHGVPYCRFGFAPLAADRILVWGPSTRQRLIQWGIPAERIRITGSPQHVLWGLSRFSRSGGLSQFSRSENGTVPFSALFSTTKPRSDIGSVPFNVLLLATVPPRDDRPDSVALHLTGRTYAEMLRVAFAAVAKIGRAELIVKLHPRSGNDPVLELLRAEFRRPRSRAVRRGHFSKWLAGVHCVLSCGSTAGVEATLAGVPVIELAPPGANGFLPHRQWNLAGTARSQRELEELLTRVAAGSWRAARGPEANVFADLGRSAAARIADEVLAPIDESEETTVTEAPVAARAAAARQALPAGYC